MKTYRAIAAAALALAINSCATVRRYDLEKYEIRFSPHIKTVSYWASEDGQKIVIEDNAGDGLLHENTDKDGKADVIYVDGKRMRGRLHQHYAEKMSSHHAAIFSYLLPRKSVVRSVV